ncbi:YggN family protein [Frateuria edaphi]|uniref:DUF2884 family protein n=1 Tax=Frateuria edaphi TaxID=2898793 RepID=UPI001E5D53BA|nr:DUF2884 family protein [Frateuria edaphi]UGB46898.1 YggN family protein [Frateuria edaphi]
MFSRKSSFVLALAAGLLLAGCSNGPDTTTIANGGIVVNGDNVALHGTGGTEAFLGATGRLVIDGHDVAVDAKQQELLKQYYRSARAVREHGVATGKAGAAVAVQSLKNAATHVTGGDSEQADARLDAATQRIDQETSKICMDIQQIRVAQKGLASSLAAFQPFATIIDGDDDDCSKGS